jgi:hypothetical protein
VALKPLDRYAFNVNVKNMISVYFACYLLKFELINDFVCVCVCVFFFFRSGFPDEVIDGKFYLFINFI